jgi:hypothetical protein
MKKILEKYLGLDLAIEKMLYGVVLYGCSATSCSSSPEGNFES